MKTAKFFMYVFSILAALNFVAALSLCWEGDYSQAWKQCAIGILLACVAKVQHGNLKRREKDEIF
jgi:hypothetical protein